MADARQGREGGAARILGAVILAAGESARMGRPKALLELQGRTFLERWLAVLEEAGIGEIRVVLGRHGPEIQARVPLLAGTVVLQPRPEEGMLSSFRLGLAALTPVVAGAFLCPVDHPRVPAGLLRRMGAALRPGGLVLPVHGVRRGHPALFSRELFPELMAAPLDAGARAVVRADPGRVAEVPAGPQVLEDVDTPADYSGLNPPRGEREP